MKKFGWAYLLLSLLGVVSTMMANLAIIHRNLIFMPIGNSFIAGFTLISPLVTLCSVLVLIFACLNRLRPRLAFLTLSSCYLGLWVMGYRLHTYYLNLYHSRPRGGFWSLATFWLPTISISHKNIPIRFIWLYLLLWLVLTIYGIYAFRKSSVDAGEIAPGEEAKIRGLEFKILMLLPSLIVGFLGSYLINILFSDFFIHGLAILLVFPLTVAFYFLALFLLSVLGRKMGVLVVGIICGGLIVIVPMAQHYVFQKIQWGFTANREAAKEGAVLVDACMRGDLNNVEALLAKGADINAKGRFGDIPLVAASQAGRREIVEMLLAKGAEVNAPSQRGRTALMAASGMGKRDIVKILLAKGAEVNARDQSGGTALMSASGCGHHEILEILLAKGAEVNAKDNIRGDTALMAACRRGHRQAVQVLLDHGADINIRNNMEGWTALLEASMYDNWGMAEMLISKGADVNARNRAGRTALSFASQKGKVEMVKLLLAHGADARSKNEALGLATQKNHPEVRELLLKAGAK
jgi:ankyrin repeat protein